MGPIHTKRIRLASEHFTGRWKAKNVAVCIIVNQILLAEGDGDTQVSDGSALIAISVLAASPSCFELRDIIFECRTCYHALSTVYKSTCRSIRISSSVAWPTTGCCRQSTRSLTFLYAEWIRMLADCTSASSPSQGVPGGTWTSALRKVFSSNYYAVQRRFWDSQFGEASAVAMVLDGKC